uniref:uncharacterized protein isoform X2 n=1 Tax=Myxine glutinosa TaxID=7769 RepID=UPI00358EAFBA
MELLEHLRRQRLSGRHLWSPSIPNLLEQCVRRVTLDGSLSRGTQSHRLTFTEVALLLQELTALYCSRVDELHLLTWRFPGGHLDGSRSEDSQLLRVQHSDGNATLKNTRDGDRRTFKNGTTRGVHHRLTISACRRCPSEEEEMQPLDDLTSSADLVLPPNPLQCREMLPIMPWVLLGIHLGSLDGLRAFWVNSSHPVASGCLFLHAIPTDSPLWKPTVPTSTCSSPTPSPSLPTSPCASFPASSTSTPLSMKSSTTTDTTDINGSDGIDDLGLGMEEEDSEDTEPRDPTPVLPVATSHPWHIEFESFDHLTPCPFVHLPSLDERIGTMMDLASFDSENQFFTSDHQVSWVNCSTPQKDGSLILSPTLFTQDGCRPQPLHLTSPLLPNVQEQGSPLVNGSVSPTSDLAEHDPVDSGVWSDPFVSLSVQVKIGLRVCWELCSRGKQTLSMMNILTSFITRTQEPHFMEQEVEVEVEGEGERCGSAHQVDIYDDEWFDRLRHWQNRVAAHLEKSWESPLLASSIEQLCTALSMGSEGGVGVSRATVSFRSLVLGESPQYAASTFLAAMHLATAGKLEIEKSGPNGFSLKLTSSAGPSQGEKVMMEYGGTRLMSRWRFFFSFLVK